MQFLALSSSVGKSLPIPLTACVTAHGSRIDQSSCTVIVYHHNSSAATSAAGWQLNFKPAIETSCTLQAVDAGLCSVCTADAAMTGSCPAGKHMFITNVVAPGGQVSDMILSMSFYVGAALFSSDVLLQFEVVAETLDAETLDASQPRASLTTMLLATQVPLHLAFAYNVLYDALALIQ